VNHHAPISWVDAVVPFVSAYQPLATGLGTLSLDLLIVVVITSLARRRFGHRAWFSLHLLSYAAWTLGLVHGFVEGTDARTTWGLGVTVGSLLAVTAALVVRPGRHPGEQASAAPEPFLPAPADTFPAHQGPVVPRPGVNPVSGPLPLSRTDTVAGPDTRRGRRAAGRRTSV